MRADAPGTLAYYLDTPFRSAYPWGKHVAASTMREAVTHSHGQLQKAQPELEAVSFYGLNQVVALLQERFSPYEPLPQWADTLASAYAQTLADQALRMTHYVTLIITRESRHLHSKDSFFGSATFGGKISGELAHFLKTLPSSSSSAAAAFMNSAPAVSMSAYVSAIVDVFNKGSFSGGYGGKPWGNIAKALLSYIDGQTTAEMFVDTAYTLAHNNGPIFNKGMYYNSYGPDLYTILDVQSSGQIAELVIGGSHKTGLSKSLSSLAILKSHMDTARKHFPEKIGAYVDWFKVEALGSKHKYPEEKKKQVEAHGKASEPAPTPQPKITLLHGVPVKEVMEVAILPTQKYTALARVKTAKASK